MSSTDTPVEEEAEVVESDAAREALLAKIQTEIGDAVVDYWSATKNLLKDIWGAFF